MDKSQCLFFSFWNYILFCALLQMLTPTHVYIFLPSFSQYESEFDDDKDIKPVYKKKKLLQQAEFMLLSASPSSAVIHTFCYCKV